MDVLCAETLDPDPQTLKGTDPWKLSRVGDAAVLSLPSSLSLGLSLCLGWGGCRGVLVDMLSRRNVDLPPAGLAQGQHPAFRVAVQ